MNFKVKIQDAQDHCLKAVIILNGVLMAFMLSKSQEQPLRVRHLSLLMTRLKTQSISHQNITQIFPKCPGEFLNPMDAGY